MAKSTALTMPFKFFKRFKVVVSLFLRCEIHDGFLIEVFAFQAARNLAIAENDDPVGDAHNFFHLRGDDQHGLTVFDE